MTTSVSLRIEGAIARLTLVNGDRGNPLGDVFGREFLNAALTIEQSKQVRVVLLTAEGKNFCVGGDLMHFAKSRDLASDVRAMTDDYHRGLSVLLRAGPPIVTAVQGACAGAGVALATLGDIVIASESAHFTIAYTAIGFSPDGASTYLLPRLLGMRKFTELALTNHRVKSSEASELGLISEVCATPEETKQRAEELAQQLSLGPTTAFARTRRLVMETFGASLEDQLANEANSLVEQCRSADVKEGIQAVLEKRAPEFKGE